MTTASKKQKNNKKTDGGEGDSSTNNSHSRKTDTSVVANNGDENNNARDRFMAEMESDTPLIRPQIAINPNVFFSTTLANNAKIIPCRGDGNCWYDGMVKGSILLGDSRGTHAVFRRDYSAWALLNPDYYISEGLTVKVATVLGEDIPINKQTSEFEARWNKAKIPGTYTDEFALKIAPAYLKAEVWIWQQTPSHSEAQINIRLAQRFTAYENTPTRQIHLLLSGENNSSTGIDGHYSLINHFVHLSRLCGS